jgi:DnaJ-class molecular chaperone
MICETCSGKGYIHTRRHPDDKDHVERCDECYQEGRVSWTDEQAAEYARRRALKQSLRANLSKSMGDPMRPTTRP